MGRQASINRILRKKVNIFNLLKQLDFSDEEVVDASKAQPKLFVEAVRFRVQMMRDATRIESQLSLVKSQTSAKFRAKLKERGERATEGQVSERLGTDPEIVSLTAKLNEAEQAEEYSKLLLEAFRMRRDALKVVADVLGAELFISKREFGTTELQKMKRKLESKYPGRVSQ